MRVPLPYSTPSPAVAGHQQGAGHLTHHGGVAARGHRQRRVRHVRALPQGAVPVWGPPGRIPGTGACVGWVVVAGDGCGGVDCGRGGWWRAAARMHDRAHAVRPPPRPSPQRPHLPPLPSPPPFP